MFFPKFFNSIHLNVMWIAVCGVLHICAGARTRTVTICFADSVLIDDTTFTLDDIATISCSQSNDKQKIAALVAGVSAPPSFSRFINGKEFVRLRCHGIFSNIAFVCKGAVRTCVVSDFRVARISEYETCIDSMVRSTTCWKKNEWSYTIENLQDSVYVMKRDVKVKVQGISRPYYPKGKENVSLLLEQGGRTYTLPVKCLFTINAMVCVTQKDVQRGNVFTKNDYCRKRMDITHFSPLPITAESELHNKKAARTIRRGTILHNRLVKEIPVVEKGEQVAIIHRSHGISISIVGVARESGGIGEKIWVKNGVTNKLLRAKITGRGIVKISCGGKKI